MSEEVCSADSDSSVDDIYAWKNRLEQLFEDLQNYSLPDHMLDEFERVLNETAQLKEEHSALVEANSALTRDLFFLKSESAAAKAALTEVQKPQRALTVQRRDSVSITSKLVSEAPTPRVLVPPAPSLFLTPKMLLSAKSLPTPKARYKLLFWTKWDDVDSHSVFQPVQKLAGFRVSCEDLEKFVPQPLSATPAVNRKRAAVTSVLPPRRALAIETMLKALSLTPDSLVSKLLTCEQSLCSDYEKLSVLYSALPRDEDFAAVQPLLNDPSVIPGQAESFVIALSSVSGLKTLVDSIIFKATFDLNRGEMEACLGNWLRICTRLRENEELRTVLQILLALGNAFNEGHPRLGAAKGFKLDILEELGGLRSPQDSSLSLLDVLLSNYLSVKGERVKFYTREEYCLLREVAAANFSTTVSSGRSLLQQYEVAEKADFSPQFRAQMTAFAACKRSDIAHLRTLIADCTIAVSEVHRYFGETEETDADGCYLLFHHLHRFYCLCEARFQQLSVGKAGKRGSKRYTFMPSERLSLKRMSRLQGSN